MLQKDSTDPPRDQPGIEDEEGLCDLFTNKEYRIQKISIPCFFRNDQSSTETIEVEFHASLAASTDFDLTGQILWPVSTLLSYFLASQKGQEIISGKRIVELGSGVGLPGLVSAHFAKNVVLTDGNDVVMELLQTNANFVHKDVNRAELHTVKFIWGDCESLEKVLNLIESADVVIAADVVQWPSVIEPLLNSVKALLWDDGRKSDKKRIFLLGIVKRATSTSDQFFKFAADLGFEWEKIEMSDFLHDGVVPPCCKESGGRVSELFCLRLTDLTTQPFLFAPKSENNSDTTLGKNYQNCGLPC